ncbi:MAG TPA: Gfo/Idh/MocA family oxidoreductase [Bacilli bacterium]|nr:MAG: putative oxidoreductase YteT precursor [Tenericutes bacterium ADurb.BinA124]HNZ50849.1 Gfo/Idh/MocA family oxidoreductase [Bacilli bacterium]HPX84687.1 Gfo/Idh/MocA family oxidoreductase [Bacilli bacterium]HQC74574.1 Gfo/Idh/MocA family oxidoreductase [Bacilli bacterium]
MKKITVAILGFGSRGFTYANIIREYPEEAQIVAVCEVNLNKKPFILSQYQLNEDQFYENEDHFFGKGKLADVLIISTMDQDHHRHALKALNLGYDLLLEKPIATTKADCQEIADYAKQLNRKVAVCHVLRYTPFYQKLKEIIDNQTIGEIVTLSQTEHIGYYHFAHSYVRGNWRNSQTSSPMVLAKSCHDLDIIRWLMGSDCTQLSSLGNLFYFNKAHAPLGSKAYCYQCQVDCPYHAFRFYKKHPMWAMIFTLNPDLETVLKDEKLSYSRCVYQSDNNVPDHQVVQMLFKNAATAQLTITAFSKEIHRSIKIHGTKGEIEGDMEGMTITVKVFGGDTWQIDVRELAKDFSGHAGGDKKMVRDFLANVRNNEPIIGLTDIKNALESHFMALDAETSRLQGGKVISR